MDDATICRKSCVLCMCTIQPRDRSLYYGYYVVPAWQYVYSTRVAPGMLDRLSCQGCVSTLCELEAEVIHDIRTRPAEPQGQSKVREELGGSPDLIGRTIIERCMNV
jgi:hypothetical protein